MSSIYFIYWLKGFLASIEQTGELPNSEQMKLIHIALDHAIRADPTGQSPS